MTSVTIYNNNKVNAYYNINNKFNFLNSQIGIRIRTYLNIE